MSTPVVRTHVWNPTDTRDQVLRLDRAVCVDRIFAALDLPKCKTKSETMTMAALGAQLYVSAHEAPGQATSYSRNRAHYIARYHDPSLALTRIPHLVDKLTDSGHLASHDRRPQTSGPTGIQSSFVPSTWIADIDLGPDAIQTKARRETIVLKDDDGNLIDYRDTDRTYADRKAVGRINKVLAEADIQLVDPSVTDVGSHYIVAGRSGRQKVAKAATQLYRVYNGGWSANGRWYGGYWQQVGKEVRQGFRISGDRVVEEDYSQAHPSLLYLMAGAHKEGDAYALKGWDRGTVKIAWNTVVNAKSHRAAVLSIMQDLAMSHAEATALVHDIKGRHPKIADYMHSGMGLMLANLDAAICRDVLLEMTVRRGIVCLPVHDSFIVAQQYLSELIFVMEEAWNRAATRIEKSRQMAA